MQDGHPPLGWHDTAAYLVLPILLIVSQYVSMEIMKPPQVNTSVLILFHFFLQGKAKLLLLTDRRSFSKEYTSYFQVSATHDWLLLTICPIRINNLLVSFSQTISMNSFIVIKFLFFIFLP